MGQEEVLKYLEERKGVSFTSAQISNDLGLKVNRSLKRLLDFKRITAERMIDKGVKWYYEYNINWRVDQSAAKNTKRTLKSKPGPVVIKGNLKKLVDNPKISNKSKATTFTFRTDGLTEKRINDLMDKGVNVSELIRAFILNYSEILK